MLYFSLTSLECFILKPKKNYIGYLFLSILLFDLINIQAPKFIDANPHYTLETALLAKRFTAPRHISIVLL